MTLDDLERQNRFLWIFWPFSPLRVYIIHKMAPRRWRHTCLWLMCIMVPMGRVQTICDFWNYNYWTGNAIGFRASHELCSNFLSELFCAQKYVSGLLPISQEPYCFGVDFWPLCSSVIQSPISGHAYCLSAHPSDSVCLYMTGMCFVSLSPPCLSVANIIIRDIPVVCF